VLRSLNELCLLGLTAGANRLSCRADDVIILSLILANGLFIVESADALSMVNNAGCHSFGVLMSETRQQNDNQHLLNPLNHCNQPNASCLKSKRGRQLKKRTSDTHCPKSVKRRFSVPDLVATSDAVMNLYSVKI
jgi:hypothetical protein